MSGAFEFRIRGGLPSQVSVVAGRCSDAIPVIVSTVAVTELPKAGTVVRSITVEPRENLGWVYLESGQVIVRVSPGGRPTVITFGNAATRG